MKKDTEIMTAQPEEQQEKRGMRISSKYKLTSWVYIAIVIIILLVVNVIANLFTYKIDFTSNKTFSLSGECKNMLDTVDRQVEIIACRDRINFTANIYLSNIAETIENMAEYSDKIDASFKSVDKNPGMTEEYPTASLSTGNIIVRLKDDPTKYRVLNIENMFETSEDGKTITESKVEYTLANAIDYVIRTDFPSVYYTTNHIEDYPDKFVALLSGNNYAVAPVNTLAVDIPEDADYIFIFNPKTDFSAAEIGKLESFLNNGGNLNKNLFVFMSPEQPSLPNLEKFLSEWGIQTDSGYLYNTKYSSDSAYNTMLLAYGDVNAAGSLYQTVGILTEQTRPLTLLFTERDYSKTTTLLSSANYTQYVSDPSAEKNPDSDPQQTGPVMAMGTKYMKNSTNESHVVVSGSYKLVEDTYMDSALGNSAYMAQIINYLDADSSKLFIFPKNMEKPLLSFSSTSAKTTAFVVFVVVIPLAVALIGFVVYLRRRHK